jgi:hypothetical protein
MLIKAANFWCSSQVFYLGYEEKIDPLATLRNIYCKVSQALYRQISVSPFGNLIEYQVSTNKEFRLGYFADDSPHLHNPYF